MKTTQNDELNLLLLFQTLWRKKFTLFFITIISLFLGIYYTVNQKISFKGSTPVYYAQQSLFIKYRAINEVLKKNESLLIENELDNYLVDQKSVFDKFIIEFQDYEEVETVLKNNRFVKETIKNLSKADQKIQLISLAKSFKILIPSNKNKETTLSFSWHNDVEGKRLFKEAILLTLENIKKTLINDVNLLAESTNEKNKRLIQDIKNQISLTEYSIELETKKRNNFLIEHYNLAKEMNIESNLLFPHTNVSSNQVNVVVSPLKDLDFDDQYFITYDNNFNNFPYYLRGYKTIKKEMEILKSRTKEQQLIMSSGYVNLKKKLLALQKNSSASELKKIAESIEKDVSDEWVKFNFELADISIQNKSIIYIILSLIVGFLFGSIYIIMTSSSNDNSRTSNQSK